MRLSVPLLTLAGTVAGTAAAVVAYQATAATGTTTPASVTTDVPSADATSWLPCDRGWKLEGDSCVRVKDKVVVVHDLPAPPAVPARSAGVRSSTHAGDDETEHGDEGEVEHGDEGEVEQGDDDSSEAGEHSDDEPDHEDVGSDD